MEKLNEKEQETLTKTQTQIEEHFRRMVEGIKDYSIISLTLDGHVASWNKGAERMFGYAANEILGRHFSLFHTKEQLKNGRPESLCKDAIKNGSASDENWRVRKDGTQFWVNVVITAQFDSAGKLQGFSKVSRDFTERKQKEKELNNELAISVKDLATASADMVVRNQELATSVKDLATANADMVVRNRELLAANEELKSFSYSVSHDLRTPLRAIDGFSLALLEDYGDKVDATGKMYLDKVRAAAQRMSRLIDDMLVLSRINTREIAIEEVDLSLLAKEVDDELRLLEPKRKVTFTSIPHAVVQADKELMRAVVINYMSNAWKFTSKLPEAKIEFGKTKDAYFIKDNGAGFDMTYVKKLFHPFQRLHGTEFPGTGIGLATVQRIIVRHGGQVWAEGAVGKGATFYFTLRGK